MNVEFIADDPRQEARRRLEAVLRSGTDQLAVACAFCTAAGVKLLERHTTRLGQPGSFVVVSATPPTNYPALGALHRRIPQHLYVHWGALSPYEIKNGAALMHSKVFYARAGNECWLWTGSHNLTGTAMLGANCEAAVLLHGRADEKPFRDALTHLQACRREATLYNPDLSPLDLAQRDELLVIHAEAGASPAGPLPWRIHLCLNSEQYDELLSPPARVRLLLYPPHSLLGGWQHATPHAAYTGSLTGLNFTGLNSRALRGGTPAEWQAASFSVVESRAVLVMVNSAGPVGSRVTTQAVLSINTPANPKESLLSDEPKMTSVPVPGEVRRSAIDPDMRRFFRRKDVEGSSLLHIPIVARRRAVRLAADEVRPADLETIRSRYAPDESVEVTLEGRSFAERKKRHPFILRTKYRLIGND